MDFADETVVVTGAARGIGRATAEAFASEGADIAIADIDGSAAESAAEELPTRSIAVKTDVSDAADVEMMVETVREELGGIDVLVNNAGVSQTVEPTVDQSIKEWERVIDIHLKGTYLCSKYAVADMLDRNSGRIVNISSTTAFGAFPYRTAYGPAKAAIRNLTKVLAVEWATEGIRVNAVAPSYIKTDLVKDLMADDKIETEKILRRTPMAEMGEPSFVADAIQFLASDRAEYITGVTLPVDGGWTAYGHY